METSEEGGNLWLNLAEKHLASRGVQWQQVEEFCFNEFSNPDDEELGVQIVKDVHRTGCSLFCGVSGKDNQALLKRVLLAYARWNKAVGYCQGFNMLAALILQVMDKSEVDSVKVMIFLIEGVLPESYFANSLRGLSVDMAVFRDLLRIKLPTLSRHFDQLQCGDSKDSGTSYEPPLTNVFTMQWFLTLFCNCLPQDTVLRVWDLIFLEGNHVLLCTALAIWSTLSDRILSVESADEFYSIMGVLTREMLEFGLMDANALIKAIVSFNLPELAELREKYLYNITPWTQSVSTVARRGLRLFYSDDDTDTEEDDEKIAIATAYGLFRSPKKKDGASGVTSPPRALTCPDKEKIAMDISALTKQYRKLRERQKQAHVILTAACGSQSLVGPATSPAMNHLLMGKFALVNSKGRRLGPPLGSIPPPSHPKHNPNERANVTISGETLHWKDAIDSKRAARKDSDEDKSPDSPPSKYSSRRGSSSSSSTELCDDPQRLSDSEDQTNSLSETCLPQDKLEPSTPLRSAQAKVHHPDDVECCREESEETIKSKVLEDSKHQTELEFSRKEDTLSISPEGDEDKPPKKRKASFRIDPEEMRLLDRKLSLKIVEIERRKSSAGIESEDLNSKVLFPFDRDYIQDAERTDPDTPSSIPDDRMCSTDDFVCDFEEESILIPDLITTHKPLGNRMTSLEECDESKVNENSDAAEIIQKGSFEENEDELRSYGDTESSEGNDEAEESRICTKFNFDELFDNKQIDACEKYTYGPLTGSADHGEHTVQTQNLEFTEKDGLSTLSTVATTGVFDNARETKSELFTLIEENGGSNDLSSNIHGTFGRSVNINIFSQQNTCASDALMDSNALQIVSGDNLDFERDDKRQVSTTESNDPKEEHDSSNETSPFISGHYKADSIHKNVKTSDNLFREKTFKDSEEPFQVQIKTTPLNLSEAQNILERKIASLLPTLPIRSSFDASLPDVTVVNSRDINLIREKYASLENTSLEPSTTDLPINDELGKHKPCHLPKSLLLNYSNPDANGFDVKADPSILERTALSEPITTVEVKSKISTPIKGNKTSTLSSLSNILTREPFIEDTTDYVSEIEKPTQTDKICHVSTKINSSDVSEEITTECIEITDEKVKLPTDESNFEEFINRPSSSSSNRRGSEVALSLILKENSQILSKIHQQSRRSSEINVDTKYLSSTFTKNETDDLQCKLQEILNVDTELISLNKSIIDNLGVTIKTSTITSLNKEEMSPSESITEVLKQCDYENISEATLPLRSNGLFTEKSELKANSLSDKSVTDETFLMNLTCLEPQKLSNAIKLSKNNELVNDEVLPDVCKIDKELNKSPKYESYNQTSNLTNNSESYISKPVIVNELLKTVNKTINPNEFGSKVFIEPYHYTNRTSIMSPTKEVEEISPIEIKPTLKLNHSYADETTSFDLSKFSNKPDENIIKPTLHSHSDEHKANASESKYSTHNISDTNADILKELRLLDIKPEETLEYSASNATQIPSHGPEDSFYSYRKKHTTNETSKFPISSEDKLYNVRQFKQTSYDYSSDFKTSRLVSKNSYKDYKAASLDIASLDNGLSDTYSNELRKSFVRSATVAENDNSLYMSSYKNHGRSLIEKGELNTYRSLDEENSSSSEVHYGVKNTLDQFDGSTYDYQKSNNAERNPPYTGLLSRDSRLTKQTQNESREKMLFKYKSEDHERSVSQSRYRFSSASPVRKRLDTLSTESSYSSLNRTKSPSPTGYHSSQSPVNKENKVYGQLDCSASDYSNGSSNDHKKYSRTESLDFNSSSGRSTVYQRKRAESFETSIPDKGRDEKTLTSPTSPLKFNPFPARSSSRQPKELGVKLGLYLPPKSDKSPSKRLT